MKPTSLLIPVLLMCLCLTGCKTIQALFARKDTPPVQQFTAQPTLAEITSAVNRNSQKIRNFTVENATIHVSGIVFPLNARLTFERPKRLRIQGFGSTLSGQEFDFGSNDNIFWLWLRRGGNEMWYCRHDLYPVSPIRSAMPVDPDWLMEALGIVEFKPADQHYGPTRQADGNWEIVSYCQKPSGQYIKRTIVDQQTGGVLRQELYSPQNELIAFAESSELRLDRGSDIIYARRIEVQYQGEKMTIILSSPVFNTPAPLSPLLFVMPEFEGYRAVDLSSQEFLQPRGVVMPTQMPPQVPTGVSVPEANMRTVIR